MSNDGVSFTLGDTMSYISNFCLSGCFILGFSTVALAADDAGKKTYDAACAACHATGVAGSPKFGDKEAWKARIEQGKDALYATALKGKGAMPAKGGRTDLSEDNVKAAVDYMVENAK